MENKINIANLIKDCPQGMELDCVLLDEPIMFDRILPETTLLYRICAKVKSGGYVFFTENGTLLTADVETKCVIFPKGKTTWEGFQRPFRDGEIVATDDGSWIGITEGGERRRFMPTYCVIKDDDKFEAYHDEKRKWGFDRLATEEEKEKLFKAIKDNGYKWDDKFKTLVKFVKPKFKVGDIIQDEDSYKVKITEVNIDDECYGYESMILNVSGGIAFKEQDEWDLAPDRFDITTLKPFDKVLVRCDNSDEWEIEFFSRYTDDRLPPYECMTNSHRYCIPYEGNEHLLGTTTDCSDFYKTWE